MSSPSDLPPLSVKPPALDNTLGACVVGLILSAVLYGITNVQTYMYFRRYDDDPIVTKSIVGFLWILDTAHQILVSHTVYALTVPGFGNYLALISPPWSDMGNIVLTAVNDLVVRTLFCHRLWRLTGNYLVTIPVMFASIASFVGALAFCIKAVPLHFTTEFRPISVSWGLYVGFGAGAASDIVMASAMVISLWKRRTGFHRTDSVMRVLMLYTVNSAVITSVCETLCLITFASMPNNFVYYGFFTVLPKLLLNSLLASYNGRHEMRELVRPSGDLVSIPLSNTSYNSSSGSNTRADKRRAGVQIEVSTEVKTDASLYLQNHLP